MTPTRYPLQWPAGWKRTGMRSDGKFSHHGKTLSIFDGIQRVLIELQRLGVNENDVVISTNVQTRLDGLPRSDQRKPDDPGVAVYWTKGGKPMRCMAVDQYHEVADNLAAVAATLAAMRAIERHGGAAILDRAFTGFTALPPPIVAGMKRDWQAVLKLQDLLRPNRDDVERAFKRLAMELHPDRGGTDAQMAELNAARDEALSEVASA